jgi:hypothetical protein
LQTTTPPVPEQAVVQVAGVIVHDSLFETWHLTLQTVFSLAAQLVLQLVLQLVDAGVSLQEYEHWA